MIMKHNSFIVATIALSLLFAGCGKDLEPVDYVNPYAGNISHLLVPTYPTVQLPNSMLRVYPERSDYTSEYLRGLPVIVTNHRERSAFKLSVVRQTDQTAVGPVVSMPYDNEHFASECGLFIGVRRTIQGYPVRQGRGNHLER